MNIDITYEKARIGRDGVLLQDALVTSTPFGLPAGVAKENT